MSERFPRDAPLRRVLASLEALGFRIVREGNHIAMLHEDEDGTRTPLTLPNHRTIKGSTLRAILRQSGIGRDEFLKVYRRAK
ncbi:MAG: type II toxin-antitoxin system HicA family toxin [Bacteroidota bacterium]